MRLMRLPFDQWVKDLAFRVYAPLGWARLPNHVTLDITRRCNLRCRMCFYYGGEGRSGLRLNELSAGEIISRVVNRLLAADYDFTGGEPLLRADLPEILIAIRRRRGRSFLTTNGTLMNRELASRLLGEDLLEGFHFSLHGLKKTHEEITRVEDSFNRTLHGIESVLEERSRRRGGGPEVSIACTITGKNMKEAEELIRLAEKIGVDYVSFGHASFMPPSAGKAHQALLDRLGLRPQPEYDDLVQGPPEIPFSKEELEIFIRALFRKENSPAKVRTSPARYGPEEVRRHFSDLNWKYRDSCFYPWRNLRIGPDGTITPCIGYVIGNIKDRELGELWNHPRFRRFRSALYREKLFPGCLRCCKLK